MVLEDDEVDLLDLKMGSKASLMEAATAFLSNTYYENGRKGIKHNVRAFHDLPVAIRVDSLRIYLPLPKEVRRKRRKEMPIGRFHISNELWYR